MKKQILIIQVFIIVIFLLPLILNSQDAKLSINRHFQDSSGNPVFNPILNPFGIQWNVSISSAAGGLITVGHTSVGGQEDILLRKLDPDGNVIFSITKNVAGTNNDYGTGVTENPSTGDIYLCGTTDNGTLNNYDIVLYHFDSSGTLLDSAIYGGSYNLNDIGVSISVNPSNGDVYLGATSQDPTTSYDYMLLHYGPTINLMGIATYDYNNLIDVPLGVEFGTSGEVCLIGASASSATNWDYCIAKFNAATLSFISDSRSNIPGVGFDQPLAFCKDATQNLYITGRASTDGINYNIRTIKVLSNLTTIAWSVVYDGVASLEDVGTSISVDSNGDVIVGGYTTDSNTKKESIVRKIDGLTGSTIWELTQPSSNSTGDALIKKLSVNQSNGRIYYLALQLGQSSFKEALVGAIYNSGSRSWERPIKSASADILPSDLDLASDGIYVSTVADASPDYYLLSKFTEFQFDSTRVFASNGNASHKKHELIVGFSPSSIKKATIDDTDGSSIFEFGSAEDFLDSSSAAQFRGAITEYCKDCDVKFGKIYENLKTYDTVAVSRLGINTSIPTFWSTLLLEFPASINIQQAMTAFKSIPNIVSFSHPNVYVYPLTAPPNDSLYNQQSSLHYTGSYTNADINVEEAWDVESTGGRFYVKAGLFDSGIHWKHQDFGYNGSNPATSKIDGWDFYSNGNGQPLKNNSGIPDSTGHGTANAGIIGADRNSILGIAGIAGGNKSIGNQGIQMFSLNIIGYPLTIALNAMLETSRGNYLAPYGFPINFSNNPWRLELSLVLDSEIVALREQVHFAWRSNITFIAARGDGGADDLVLPSGYDSTWIVSVGGTSSIGQYKNTAIEEAWWAPSYGSGIDVAAPAVYSLVRTTNPTPNYVQFNGTSASVPHVSGVVGLLMSHLNDTTGAFVYKNLAPEDCEFILKHSASGYPIYDTLVGYGRINAGKALKMIQKNKYNLLHFGTNILTAHSITKSLYALNDTVRLTERYSVPFVNQTYNPGKYVVNTFYIYGNVYHNLNPLNDSIISFWPRHSSCYVFGLPKVVGTKKYLDLHEREKINFLSSSSAALQGFIYQVKDSIGNPLGWWPCDTSFSALFNNGYRPKTIFEYSVLTKNKNLVGIKEFTEQTQCVRIYPNPADKVQTLIIDTEKDSDCTIDLYDMLGRHLKTIYQGKTTAGQTFITHQIENLPNSLYIYNIKIDEKSTYKKFLKE